MVYFSQTRQKDRAGRNIHGLVRDNRALFDTSAKNHDSFAKGSKVLPVYKIMYATDAGNIHKTPRV